jgi:hypothetical protein
MQHCVKISKQSVKNFRRSEILVRSFCITLHNNNIITCSYSNATLCQNFKAIGKELSEILNFAYILVHMVFAYVLLEVCNISGNVCLISWLIRCLGFSILFGFRHEMGQIAPEMLQNVRNACYYRFAIC